MSDPTAKLEGLNAKLAEAKRLGEKLQASRALEARFPGLFEDGSVKLRLYSEGSMGRPMIEVVKNGDAGLKVPLVELPVVVVRDFIETIRKMAARHHNAHKDWQIAAKMIKENT